MPLHPDHPFPQSLLDHLDEPDRLLGLSQAVDITVEEHAVTKEWVLTITPKAETPLPIQPETHRASTIHQLNQTIRATWEAIANLAKDNTKASIDEAVAELTSRAPTSPLEHPSYADWIPTNNPQQFESVQTITSWTIDAYSITPSTQHLDLILTDTSITIIDPTGVHHPIEVIATHTENEVLQPIEQDEEPFIDVDISSDASMDYAIHRAQEEALRNITPERQADLAKLKRQLQLIHFVDGFTTFTGVAAFLVGAAFIYRFAGFIGSVVFALVVLVIYMRFGPRVLLRF